MKAAITTEGGDFEIADLPDPTPGPDQLVVRVAACGVCGSDLKAQPFMAPGTVMGHEIGGEVVALGSEVGEAGWRAGMTVAVLPVVSCGGCVCCVRGDVAHCSSVRFIGMGNDSGGFAEFVLVSARHAFRIPATMPAKFAALVEPFAVGLHCVAACDIGPGDHVLIVGAGGVGLTALAWARAHGAERVTVVDPAPARRAVGEAMGATDLLSSVADADDASYDALIECVGRPELVEACMALARARGRITIAGACDQPIGVEPISGLLKELTIRFSLAYRPDDFLAVIDAFTTGIIDPASMLGKTVGLDRVSAAFEMVRTVAAEGRVLVSPIAE
jgi:(R,R)-butanediol dehydrogenase / meso-butanediol dehydrogenase / diacetyl reductase